MQRMVPTGAIHPCAVVVAFALGALLPEMTRVEAEEPPRGLAGELEKLLQLLDSARRSGLVAIVEDDTALSDNLCEALRDRGFSAVTASSVLETEGLKPLAPFLALVDLKVPGGPAGEAMRLLAAKYPGLPMLVITAYPDESVPLPAEATFLKPFDSALLYTVVFEERADDEGEYYHLVTLWKATRRERAKYGEIL